MRYFSALRPHEGLADAAAKVLADPALVSGISAPLTGSAALDPGEVSGMLSELTAARSRESR